MNWRETAAHIIGEVHKSLPPNADIKTRKRALADARPYEFRVTSHGRKTWGKAATAYLVKCGMKPRKPPHEPDHLSPLERMMKKAAVAESAP